MRNKYDTFRLKNSPANWVEYSTSMLLRKCTIELNFMIIILWYRKVAYKFLQLFGKLCPCSGSQEVLDISHASYPTSDYKPPVSPGAPVDSDDYEDDDDHHPKSYEAQAPYPQYAGMMT